MNESFTMVDSRASLNRRWQLKQKALALAQCVSEQYQLSMEEMLGRATQAFGNVKDGPVVLRAEEGITDNRWPRFFALRAYGELAVKFTCVWEIATVKSIRMNIPLIQSKYFQE